MKSFCMKGYFYILSYSLFKSICQKLNISFKNPSPPEKNIKDSLLSHTLDLTLEGHKD